MQTPKHLVLGMTVRHLTGSSKLISILNGFGHSVSHSVVLQYDTALGKLQMAHGENVLPSAVAPDTYSTLAWDNWDFGEETLSGYPLI